MMSGWYRSLGAWVETLIAQCTHLCLIISLLCTLVVRIRMLLFLLLTSYLTATQLGGRRVRRAGGPRPRYPTTSLPRSQGVLGCPSPDTPSPSPTPRAPPDTS
ncbi:hypothetical protein FA95DRAFT_1157079 [Auriscalpium vulgare]|uniref:Uncharacterized protein n=1 Tax=Auriscalpium vulgare TaxID=40419 RepID=A0ACB8R3M1_9AGAM|nr:hypothetical protein FA95DRAFT_1157079 [Auriscalpium vulgare]